MEGIRERYERALSQREDILEESGGDGDREGKGDNYGEINLVVRREEKHREGEEQEGSTSEAETNDDDVAEGKEEQVIATNTATAADERGEEWNVWVAGKDKLTPRVTKSPIFQPIIPHWPWPSFPPSATTTIAMTTTKTTTKNKMKEELAASASTLWKDAEEIADLIA